MWLLLLLIAEETFGVWFPVPKKSAVSGKTFNNNNNNNNNNKIAKIEIIITITTTVVIIKPCDQKTPLKNLEILFNIIIIFNSFYY